MTVWKPLAFGTSLLGIMEWGGAMGGNEPERFLDPAIAKALSDLPSEFSGFGYTFQDEIRPQLQAREAERERAASRSRQATIAGVGVGVIGAAVSLLALRIPQLAMVAGFLGLMLHTGGRWPLRKLSKDAKMLIIDPVAREFALQYSEAPGEQPLIQRFRGLRLVPSWDRSSYEDKLVGERGGKPFEFFEAHLEQRRTSTDSRGRTTTRWVTVFAGQCIVVRFHKEFRGTTLVMRDAGIFNRFGGGKGLKRARLEDPVFEKAFEVYTDDQVEARYLLTPDFMQRLVDLETAFHGGKLQCAFSGGELFITVEGGDLFEPGSMFTPLDNPERIRELLGDFAAIFEVIDGVGEKRGGELD